MRDAFSEQLDDVYDDLADLADQVQAAVRRAARALLEGDAFTAEEVIKGDARIDRIREKIEERCFRILSLQQPVAGDLRTIVAALRIVADLERMGDLAQHIAEVARARVPDRAVPEPLVGSVRRMGELAEQLVAQAGAAIASRDPEDAAGLAAAEQELDGLHDALFTELRSATWEHGVAAAVDLALLGRYFERLGDHAVSVANRVVYVATGRRGTVD